MKKLSYVTDEKGHGYFRKNKAVKGLATAIAIGGVLISSSNAKADEVTDVAATGNDVLAEAGDTSLAAVVSETTATNYSEPQPEASAEHLQALANEGQVVGEGITSPVESSSLDQAVAEAEAVDVEVVKSTSPAIYDNLNEAQADLDGQEKTVDKATDTKVEVDSILAENTEKVKEAGVIEDKKATKTYIDDNAGALKDAKEQSGRGTIASQTKIQITADYSQAIRQALNEDITIKGISTDGDKIVFDDTVNFKDSKQALEKLAVEIAKLESTVMTKQEIDKMISLALADMEKAGIKYTLKQSTNSISDLKEVLDKASQLVSDIEQVYKDKEAHIELSNKVSDYNKQLDVYGNSGETITVSSLEEAEKVYKELASKNTLTKEEAEKIHASNKAIFDAKGLTYTGNYETDKAAVDKWNAENAGTFEKVDASKTTGLRATDSTTVRVTSGHSAVPYSTRGVYWALMSDGGNLNLHNDYNIKATAMAVKGEAVTFRVENTTNGGLTLEFSNVQSMRSVSNDNQAYAVAVFTKPGGGIGFAVEAIGSYSGGGNVGPEGLSAAVSGGGYGPIIIESFTVKVTTDNGDVQYITYNDIDNRQSVTSNLGSATNTGSSISASGNTYSGTSSNATDGTIGVLGSGSVEWTFGNTATFTHRNTNSDLLNIVAGVFGPSSVHETKVTEVIEPISIQEVKTVDVARIKVEDFKEQTFEVPSISVDVTGIQMVVETHPIDIAVTVHPVKVVQNPVNVKGVVNADGVDINGQSVVKGDLVSWDTGGETLKAGRPQFSRITRTDYLRAGQTVDMDLTRASHADIEFTYDSAKHAVIQTVSSRVLAEANLDQTKAFILPEGKIYATPVHDGGEWENTFETIFEYADSVIIDKDGKVKTEGTVNTYKVTSNKVGYTTPEKADPEKHIYTADGERVDGKSLLPNTTYYYTAVWDLSKYKEVVSTAKQIAEGFAYIGDPQDNTVRFDKLNYVWETSSGETISNDFIKAYEFNSLDDVPEEYKDLIVGSGVTPDGYFVAYIPRDYNKFYQDYVIKGEKLYLTFAVHTDSYVGDFENKVYQIDFGNGYEGNIVQNHVPKLEAIKDVIDHIGSNKSLNNANIELGQKFPYVLSSPAIPMNLAGGVHEAMLYDDFDENYDRYDGEYYAFLTRPLELKNGKGLVTDEEFTKYVRQVVERNDAGEIVAVKFYVEEDFLAQIKEDQILEYVVYPMMTRIAYGENIENTLVAYINGVEVSRTKVVTHTPKPVPPVEQGQPGTPVEAPVTPVKQAPIGQPATPTLPKTGESTQAAALFAGLGLMTLAGLGFAKRKEDY